MDDIGGTPLLYVSGGKHDFEEAGVGVARLLLERGVDVNREGEEQRTPLHAASFNGKPEIARLLLDYDAKVDAVDDFGNTPLHDVSRRGYYSEEASVGVVRLLLEHGGDVNGQNKQQQTPLHIASCGRKLEVARLLLDNGAKLDAVDEQGNNPLHNVLQGWYHPEEAGVIRLLLEHGADVNAKARSGETPLDLVSDRRPVLAERLREHGARPGASSSWTGFFNR